MLHKGEVFLRKAGDASYRAVGNSSQLRINHVEDGMLLLSATEVDKCCGLLGASVELLVHCLDDENLSIGILGSTPSSAGASNGSKTFTFTSTSLAGSFFALDHLADVSTIVVTGLPAGTYSVNSGGVQLNQDVSVASVRVVYRRLESTSVSAGENCELDQELLYIGTNAFDGTKVRLYIPKVRLQAVDSFDWINPSNAAELSLKGRIIFDEVWYTVQREYTADC